jgi:hypothetical protein
MHRAVFVEVSTISTFVVWDVVCYLCAFGQGRVFLIITGPPIVTRLAAFV